MFPLPQLMTSLAPGRARSFLPYPALGGRDTSHWAKTEGLYSGLSRRAKRHPGLYKTSESRRSLSEYCVRIQQLSLGVVPWKSLHSPAQGPSLVIAPFTNSLQQGDVGATD